MIIALSLMNVRRSVGYRGRKAKERNVDKLIKNNSKRALLIPPPDCHFKTSRHRSKRRFQVVVVRGHLKCHWDQNFGIPCFYIFEHSLWFLVTLPNFNLLRRLEVAFFGRFLSRFCGRHYWPLFRKLACE